MSPKYQRLKRATPFIVYKNSDYFKYTVVQLPSELLKNVCRKRCYEECDLPKFSPVSYYKRDQMIFLDRDNHCDGWSLMKCYVPASYTILNHTQ